jgi:hypothetical protein
VHAEVVTPQSADAWGTAYGSKESSAVVIPAGLQSMWEWYKLYLQPGGGLDDQHGWRDPVSDRLWLKGQRLTPKQGRPLWRQLSARAVTQAFFVPLGTVGGYHYVSKRVGGIRTGVNAWDPTWWFPTRK